MTESEPAALIGVPRLHHPLQRLLEIMEEHCVLAFGVTAFPGTYDLYYWKFKSIEIKNLKRKPSIDWVCAELVGIGYSEALIKNIASEIYRLTDGNPGSISQTISAIGCQTIPIDDPIRIRRIFLEGKISRLV